MKGILQIKDGKWYIESLSAIYPVLPSSILVTRCIPGKEVEWEPYPYWETGMEEVIEFAEVKPDLPYVSDDFQIGPNGAYEYCEDTRYFDTRPVLKKIIAVLKSRPNFKNVDVSDLGNELGFAVGTVFENFTEEETRSFIHGIQHGISLTNGTH